MLSKESIFLTISVLAGLTFFILGPYVRKHEKSTRADLFCFVMVFMGINVFSYFFELISDKAETMIIWNKIFYTSLILYLSFWLLFSIEYKFENTVLSRHFKLYLILLIVVPAVTILFNWFQGNGLFLSFTGCKDVGSLSAITLKMGVLYWVHSVYSWCLVITTTVLILAKISRLGRAYRLQAIVISIGVFTPMIYNLTSHILFFIIKILPPFSFKFTQLTYVVTAITFTWGIFGEKFLDIVPIARRIVFDNVDDLIFVINTESRIIDANNSARSSIRSGIIEYHTDDIEGRSINKIFAGHPKLLDILNSGREGRNEVIFQSANERKYFDVSLSGITDKKNRLIGRVAILRDISDIRNAQEQLIQSEKMAALGGLVAGVAHEINTPVGISITAASSLAEETNQMATQFEQNKITRASFKDYLDTINQSTRLIQTNMEKAASMIQSFKQVSVDQSTEQHRKFKLREYLEDVIRSLYPKLKEKDIKINLEIDDNLELDSFPGAFSQIITNLVLNSLTHGFKEKDEGKIEIKARLEKDKLDLEYSDNGKGILAENLSKIFEPFFTTSKKTGTGLGLHIVYNLVTHKLNGSINCESEPGKGAKFNIEVPVT